ncbi:hypothetical protein ABPG74_015422 [Tetrahymena malaccensis]
MQRAKIQIILEQINIHDYQNALKSIQQLFGKEKNKSKISDDEQQWLKLLQGVCYAKLSYYGEAKQLFNEFTSKQCLLNLQENEIQLVLENISQPLDMIGKVRELCEDNMTKQKLDKDPKTLQDIFRMCIKESNFVGAQKIAKKLFTATKETKYIFADIVFQFYQLCQLDETNDAAKIAQDMKLINLFINKIYTDIQLNPEGGISKAKDPNLAKQLVRFHYRLYEKQKNYKDMLSVLLTKYPDAFNDYLEHLEKLEELFNQDHSLYSIVLKKNFEAFLTNSQMDKFQMVYETYDKFCSFLFKQVQITSTIETIDSSNQFAGNLFEEVKGGEELKPSFEHIERYYCSLESHKQLLKSTQSTHHHFKNAIKCIIQAQFGVLNRILASNQKLNADKYELSAYFETKYKELIDDYIKYFAIILTFPEEIFNSLKDAPKSLKSYAISQTEALKETSAINRCIVHTNIYKLKIIFQEFNLFSLPANEYVSALYNIWKELLENYSSYYKEIYPDFENKYVEKGERLYTDDFVIIAADLAIDFIYRQPSIESKEVFGLLMQTTFILEAALKKSGFNYDIQLRLLLISIVLGNKDRVYDLIKALDIKSVQYETLGFLYLSTALDYGFDVSAEENTSNALQYYIENLRESKEAMIASIKSDNFEKIWEFKAYDEWINKSYFKMMAFYAKSQILLKESAKKDTNTLNVNVEYFNQFCMNKLGKESDQIVWNFDMRVIQSICCNEYSTQSHKFYWNYLGLYNDSSFLKLNILSTQVLYKIKETLNSELNEEQTIAVSKEIDELITYSKQTQKSCTFDKLSDLSNFKFYNKPEYLQKYHTQKDYQTTELSKKYEFEHLFQTQSLELAEILNRFISLNTKTTGEQLESLKNKFEQISNSIQEGVKKLHEDFQYNHESEIFPITFFKNFNRFSSTHLKFLEVLFKNQEQIQQRIQKPMKKNQDLKKVCQEFQKKIKSECEKIASILIAGLTEISKKIEPLLAEAKDSVSQFVRDVINKKQIDSSSISIFDLANSFPALKKEDVLLKLSEEIGLNYKFLYSVIIDLIKESQKLFKQK